MWAPENLRLGSIKRKRKKRKRKKEKKIKNG
jgi:hypothetical protein